MSGGIGKTIGHILISPLGTALGLFKHKSQPASPLTPNYALQDQQQEDALRLRRGAGANILAGATAGAEPMTPGAKTLLGQ